MLCLGLTNTSFVQCYSLVSRTVCCTLVFNFALFSNFCFACFASQTSGLCGAFPSAPVKSVTRFCYALLLRQIRRVTVPILVDTNPYSLEKRKNGEVSGSGHAAFTSSIKARILPESNFFRSTEYPMFGHVMSRLVHVLIFLGLPRIMECR